MSDNINRHFAMIHLFRWRDLITDYSKALLENGITFTQEYNTLLPSQFFKKHDKLMTQFEAAYSLYSVRYVWLFLSHMHELCDSVHVARVILHATSRVKRLYDYAFMACRSSDGSPIKRPSWNEESEGIHAPSIFHDSNIRSYPGFYWNQSVWEMYRGKCENDNLWNMITKWISSSVVTDHNISPQEVYAIAKGFNVACSLILLALHQSKDWTCSNDSISNDHMH